MGKINESYLEMLYFFPLKEVFYSEFKGKINAMYKPSQQDESWLGFDQAWTNKSFSEEEFYEKVTDKYKQSNLLRIFYNSKL